LYFGALVATGGRPLLNKPYRKKELAAAFQQIEAGRT